MFFVSFLLLSVFFLLLLLFFSFELFDFSIFLLTYNLCFEAKTRKIYTHVHSGFTGVMGYTFYGRAIHI